MRGSSLRIPAAGIEARASELGVGESTYRELRELEHRDIEPEDYDLLSRLHARAARRTLTQEEVDLRLPAFELTEAMPERCLVCMVEMEAGERVRRLPCSGKHTYHDECIASWLTQSSTCCPADREDLCER